jgi:TatA/E family protein of Tat protein translocase
VVVGIDVLVQQVVAGGTGERVEDGHLAALADVHHALEHLYTRLVNLGAPELLIILLIILLIFGGAKLPQLARSLGKAQSEFKKGSEEETSRDTDTPA